MLSNEHQLLSSINHLVFVKDRSRFDRVLSVEEIKVIINQVETEEERKKQLMLFDAANHMAKLRE